MVVTNGLTLIETPVSIAVPVVQLPLYHCQCVAEPKLPEIILIIEESPIQIELLNACKAGVTGGNKYSVNEYGEIPSCSLKLSFLVKLLLV